MATQLADVVAAHLANFRAGYGTRITWKGTSYSARIVQPQRRQFEFLAEGLGINAASGDVRYVMLTPAEFGGGIYPAESDTVSLDTDAGLVFQVLRKWIRAISGIPHTVQLLIYREAPPAASTDAAGSEPGAGARKQYWP